MAKQALRQYQGRGQTREAITRAITARDELFIHHYLAFGKPTFLNALASIKAAGINKPGAANQADVTRHKPAVRAAIRRYLASSGATMARCLHELTRQAFDMDLADYNGFLTGKVDLAEMRTAGVNTKCLKSARHRITKDGENFEIELIDRQRALENLVDLLKDAEPNPMIDPEDAPGPGNTVIHEERVQLICQLIRSRLSKPLVPEGRPMLTANTEVEGNDSEPA